MEKKKSKESLKKEQKKVKNQTKNQTARVDNIPDEEILKLDYSKIEPDSDGNRVLAEMTLASLYKPIGVYSMTVPIRNDKAAIENNVVLRINVPFIFQFPILFIDSGKRREFYERGISILPIGDVAFGIGVETERALSDVFEKTGDASDRIDVLSSENGGGVEEDSDGEYGYNKETGEYIFNDEIYHENDVIWQVIEVDPEPVPSMNANVNDDPLFTSCDVSGVEISEDENLKNKLTDREIFEIEFHGLNKEFFEKATIPQRVLYLSRECAKTKDTSGTCIVCIDGHFYVPVESFLNTNTLEVDEIIVPFNTAACLPQHHACFCTIIADVGNLSILTAARYCKGSTIDWHKRFSQELDKMHIKYPDYDPYDDPYDNVSVVLP